MAFLSMISKFENYGDNTTRCFNLFAAAGTAPMDVLPRILHLADSFRAGILTFRDIAYWGDLGRSIPTSRSREPVDRLAQCAAIVFS